MFTYFIKLKSRLNNSFKREYKKKTSKKNIFYNRVVLQINFFKPVFFKYKKRLYLDVVFCLVLYISLF